MRYFSAVILNLFCDVAHFKRSQIFVAHSHVMMTMSLGSASDPAAEVISKKKDHCLPSAENGRFACGIRVDLQRKIMSLHLQFMGAGPCGCSCGPVFLNLIRHANPSLKYADVRGPPVLRAVAYRLTTSALACSIREIISIHYTLKLHGGVVVTTSALQLEILKLQVIPLSSHNAIIRLKIVHTAFVLSSQDIRKNQRRKDGPKTRKNIKMVKNM